MPLGVGEQFAGYTVVGLLGSGGMGEVYLVKHPRLPRHDALKVLPATISADPDFRARFEREADLAATLWHPHIVGVHDRGEDDGRLWIAMDYVAGHDAAALLRDQHPTGLPADQVATIVTAVAEALDHAHQRHLLHRDVKPANILLTDDTTDKRRILLADFGIARHTEDTAGLTATNMTVGSVNYTAPEQLMGEPIDTRTDQYALAATTYHLLTGTPPFPHPNPAVVISRHLNTTPPTLAPTHPQLAAADPVLGIALAKNPTDRYPTTTDFATALTQALTDQTPTTTTTSTTTTAPSAPARVTLTDSPTTYLPQPTPQAPPIHVSTWGTPPPDDNGDAGEVLAPPPAAGRTRATGGTINATTVGIAVGAVILIAVIAIVAGVTNRPTASPTASSTASAAAPSMTFESMRDFVTRYYADLPGQPLAAWEQLDSHCKQQTGQRDFLDFWATIESVAVVSITPRDATSVTTRLTYTRRNGQRDTEDRWLRMSTQNGVLLLDESERIGPATTMQVPTSTNPALNRTQVVVTAAVVDGQPANGYTAEPTSTAGNEVFGCESSPAAVADGIYDCFPSAAAADVCWPATTGTLLCIDSPWEHQLRRATYTDPLPRAERPTAAVPFALLLDDGTRCRVRNGGAWGGRDDGLYGAYGCYADDRIVLAAQNAPAINDSQPTWTVKVGPLGGGNQHFPPPETRSVTTAWYAGN